MRKKCLILLLAWSLLLSGCSWMEGSYVSIETHHAQPQEEHAGFVAAENYLQLMDALEAMIAAGLETGVIYVPDYDNGTVEAGMSIATAYATKNSPVGAYAVEDIHYELGTSNGLRAVAVNMEYRHSLAELQRIRRVADIPEAEQVIASALEECEASVVMMVEAYTETDFVQIVEDYAVSYPAVVMETPYVSEVIYGTGDSRVVELIFTYRNSRDSLRQMREQVMPVFDAAALYVSGDGAHRQKFSQLYAFLMERFDYTLETSLTPAYSLLRYGVGDSRAFATVYAAMCRKAGLNCMIVTGTRSGQPWTWNMVQDNGNYYHVDLLRSEEEGYFQEFSDMDMDGYVWDYSTYPRCNVPVVPEEEDKIPGFPKPTEPAEPPVVTEPEETAPPVVEPTEPPTEAPTMPPEPTEPEETVPTMPSEPTEGTQPPTEPEQTTPEIQPSTEPSQPPEIPSEPTVPGNKK